MVPSTTPFTTRIFSTTTSTTTSTAPPTKPPTVLLFPVGSTPDEINDVIAELPDQDSPITVIVGDTVVEDQVAPSETMVEPDQVKDITEPLTADDLPPVLENLTDTVIIPIVTNDNPEVIDILQGNGYQEYYKSKPFVTCAKVI